VPVGQQHHGGVAVAVSIGLGGIRQALDLGIGQISRVRNSAFGRRSGVATVRLSVSGDTNLRCDFAMIFRAPAKSTVRRIRKGWFKTKAAAAGSPCEGNQRPRRLAVSG
jgi:hypothetical protein